MEDSLIFQPLNVLEINTYPDQIFSEANLFFFSGIRHRGFDGVVNLPSIRGEMSTSALTRDGYLGRILSSEVKFDELFSVG